MNIFERLSDLVGSFDIDASASMYATSGVFGEVSVTLNTPNVANGDLSQTVQACRCPDGSFVTHPSTTTPKMVVTPSDVVNVPSPAFVTAPLITKEFVPTVLDVLVVSGTLALCASGVTIRKVDLDADVVTPLLVPGSAVRAAFELIGPFDSLQVAAFDDRVFMSASSALGVFSVVIDQAQFAVVSAFIDPKTVTVDVLNSVDLLSVAAESNSVSFSTAANGNVVCSPGLFDAAPAVDSLLLQESVLALETLNVCVRVPESCFPFLLSSENGRHIVVASLVVR